jgi:hypothetical protein
MSNLIIEFTVYGDVNIPVDGTTNDGTMICIFPVKTGQICATASKTNSKWRLGNNHCPDSVNYGSDSGFCPADMGMGISPVIATDNASQ